jgi:7-keto-8-aminopelargonate synthetase-like enzyme
MLMSDVFGNSRHNFSVFLIRILVSKVVIFDLTDYLGLSQKPKLKNARTDKFIPL